MRRVLSLRVAATGVAVLLIAVLSYALNFGLWANRTLVDSDRFAETTVEALSEDTSLLALANLAVNRVVKAVPALEPVAEPMKRVVVNALGSDQVSEAFIAIGSRLHAVFFDGSSDGLVVDFSRLRQRVEDAVSAISPQLVRLLPEDVFQDIVLIEPGEIPELSPAVDTFRKVMWLALVLLIIAVGVVFWRTRSRARALIITGSGITIGGLITAVIVPGGRALTVGAASDPDAEILIANLYDHAVVGLKTQSRIILLIGIGLVVAGYVLRRRQASELT